MNRVKQYIILANGAFPTSKKLISLISNADVLVCCDGAISALEAASIRIPDYIVGDMDSISQEYKVRYEKKIIKNSDQETNDLTKAFDLVISLLTKDELFEISILGATGKREDHTLGNVSLLHSYAHRISSMNGTVSIISDFGTFFPRFDTCFFKTKKGTPVSIFSDDPTLKISAEGLIYPTENVVFDSWWKATLNKTSSDLFKLNFNHSAKVLVYLANVL